MNYIFIYSNPFYKIIFQVEEVGQARVAKAYTRAEMCLSINRGENHRVEKGTHGEIQEEKESKYKSKYIGYVHEIFKIHFLKNCN